MFLLAAAWLGDLPADAQGQDQGQGAPQDKRKQRLVALVLPGVKRVPGYEKVRPYTSPGSEGDPPIEPTDVKVVEAIEENEALVLQHPYISPLIGAVVQGARVPVKGVVRAQGKSGRGCSTHLWYALDPWGYVCSRSVKPTTEPPTQEVAMPVSEGERVPYHYVMVGVPEGVGVPMWSSLESLRTGEEPERELQRGDTVAVQKTLKLSGAQYYVSVEGKVLPVEGTHSLDAKVSAWRGEVLDDKTVFPFGWVTPETAKVYAVPDPRTKPIETLPRRTRVVIAEEQGKGGRRMLRIADAPGAGPGDGQADAQGQGQSPARWVRAADVNEVRRLPRPEGISPAAQWIDVDLGEQVLVAYMGEQPVYATLTSSGRAIPTPRGNYPVWAKVSVISMKSQPYEDKPYFVNKVPWVLFFQAHNAIHGAYWHDRFGVSKSHGCVNVSPLDARYLFEWLTPGLPSGWTGVRPPDLMASPTVHVRNSHQKVELLQERPIGPPDKELEALKLEEAETRRAAEGAAAATPATEAPTGMQP
jgi:hypothetical protein